MEDLTLNWDALGALAELIGAVAVIASLIYLARQIKHASQQLRAQAENDVYTRVYQAYDPVYQHNNGDILWRGLQANAELSDSERFVFDLLMDRQMTVLIQTAHQAERGLLQADVLKHFAAHYKRIYTDSPGGADWIRKNTHVVGGALRALGIEHETRENGAGAQRPLG